jgi:RNA polymerase sigma-70 factor (ECF subfamily)
MSIASMLSLRDGEGALRGELRHNLAAALDKIPDEFRVVVVLADVVELSYREIADVLDCPMGTVMSRLHRGRRLLRTHLFQEARDLGILTPEDFIGQGPEECSPAERSPAEPPIALEAYRSQAGSGKGRP